MPKPACPESIARLRRRLVALALFAPLLGVLGMADAALPQRGARRADFNRTNPSAAARRVVDWVVASNDHHGEPFFIIDKPNARLLVFDARGRVLGATPVLLGLARGDDTAPGIGNKPLAQIRDDERTTPAGRFVAERGRNLHGDDILWVDYDAAVSMHRVRSVNAGERRLERLRSPTPRDNRISYGCINVPKPFFDRVVDRAIARRKTVLVYVLPDVKPLEAVFAGLPPAQRAATPARPAQATLRGPGLGTG